MIVGSFGHYSVEPAHDHELRRVLGEPRGRLRQGKIYLLDAAANTFDGLFLTAADSTETGSLASFGRVLASYSGGGRYAFADWDGTGAAVRGGSRSAPARPDPG